MYIKLNLVKKIKPLLFFLLLTPSIYWTTKFYLGDMGINPIDKIIREFGNFSLRLIIFTLFITPLAKIKALRSIEILRRMIGLFAFYYICLHFISYIFLDHFFNWNYILKDVYKRPFITFGFTSFILCIPLAATSNNKLIKRIGYKIWKKIHRLIYFIAPLAALHYYLLTKADKTEPLIYIILIVILLVFRIFYYLSKKDSLPR
ncbi:MAG: Protein-methionine-sulfoxide reductase heme-binding subunit MsrQ [Alphaproteobacteria bacterium MarineAlpha5_Bin11]|nr:sulfoxide reductase heme-binding subunit YedZ [Pelagibacteraceae bacterium]PPR44578.1 MAG: Protein-methionine-sulfoxide reductase heme-binding subunit MsrQ [Alphaproteobacteria bacterium MarineAlpha5_Bin11]PPR50874.1 MAG: Protein-methionine-sulfoxide reductase heme-binding subunit MsrQ [Alphaproteobacteria bacterium MarineAlpha5_Bin10]|tara:strand:+ start:8627 stop:9238 length:612 start_codon:yes stop_codon:yes gene_type:complete